MGQTTGTTSQQPNPEQMRLLRSGEATIEVADFGAVTGGYEGAVSVDNPLLNLDLSSTGYHFEAWHRIPHNLSPGSANEWRVLPYTRFNDYSTGEVYRNATLSFSELVAILNVKNLLVITYFTDTDAAETADSAGNDQTFFWQVYSTRLDLTS